MIVNIITKFLESDCYEEKKFIANYKDEKYDINLNICEYACKNNDINFIQQVKNYYDGDLMEYYSNNKVIKLEIIKILYSKYNSNYFINICNNNYNNLECIKYLLKFNVNNYKAFDIIIKKSNINIIELFLCYGYKINHVYFELLISRNLLTKKIIINYKNLINNKNILLNIIKNYRNLEIIEIILNLEINYNVSSFDKKNILSHLCLNNSINLNIIQKVFIKLDNPFEYDNYNKNCVIYYLFNKNYSNDIIEFFLNNGFKFNNLDNFITDIDNIEVLKMLRKNNYNIELYDIINSNYICNYDILKYYNEEFDILDYIHLDKFIFDLAIKEKYDTLIYVLEKLPDFVNCIDDNNNSILNIICMNQVKDLKIIEELKNKNINIYNKNSNGYNCIFSLILSNVYNKDIIEYFLNNILLASSYDYNLNTLYHIFIKNNVELEYFELLYKKYKNINISNNNNDTPLIYSYIYNRIDISNFLISNNCNLNTKNCDNLYSIDYLIKLDNIDLKILLKYKNYINFKTVINYLKNDMLQIDIFNFLIGNCINKYVKDCNGNNILLHLSQKYIPNVFIKIKLFLILDKYNYNFNTLNKNRENCLILTLKYNYNLDLVNFLLSKKVSTIIRNNNGNNALMYSKDFEMFSILNKISIKRNNIYKQNLIHRLFKFNYLNSEFILELTKDYNFLNKDIFNKNILDYFIENNNLNIDIFSFLLKIFKLNNKNINNILELNKNELCKYLIHNKLLDTNYINDKEKGILDYFYYDYSIIKLLKNNYKLKLNTINKNIQYLSLLEFIKLENVDNIFLNTNSIIIKKKIMMSYKLKDSTIIQIYNNNKLISTLIDSNLNLKLLDNEKNNLLMILLKNNCNFKYINYLVEHKIFHLNYLNKKFRTVLFFVVNDIIILRYLIKKNACPYILDIDNESLLFHACRILNNDKVVKYLLNIIKLDINLKNNEFNPAIFYTTDYNIMKLLLSYDEINKNIVDINGNTFLNYYCKINNCNYDILNLLINNGYNINTKNYYNETVLFSYLTINDDISCLLLLLKNNTTFNNLDIYGNNILLFIIKNKINYTIIKILINNLININIVDIYNKNCLFYLLDENYLNIIKLLVTNKINVNHKIYNDKTFLMCLSSLGLTKIIEYLLLNTNIDINMVDNYNNNALSYACGLDNENGDLDTIKLLINNKCDYNILDNNKNSLLHISSGVNGYNIPDIEIINYLLKKNIDKNIINNNGNNYIFYLTEESFELLLNKNIVNINEQDIIEFIYTKNITKYMNNIEYIYLNLDNTECNICTDKIKQDESYIKCINNHFFHRKCLLKWYITSKKVNCPFCTIRLMLDNKYFIVR